MTKRRRTADAPRRYEARAGHTYAIDPKAFFDWFMSPESRDNERVGDVEIVDVEGPLEYQAGGWCDSYSAIVGRVAAACASDAKAIVMRIDSPGGDSAGCFDAARAIRAACVNANKPLFAHVTDKACSAAYAIASAATHGIGLGDSAIVGSIGVISQRADVSAANAARGIRIAMITSGARKADSHPDVPLTDDEIAATQTVVDSVAKVFFALIEDHRGIDATAVAALEAGVFHGEAAISARLADVTQSYESFLAAIAEGTSIMATAYEKARASLEEAAKGDDANAAAAKRALAAMEEPKSEGDTEPPKKDDDGDDDADKKDDDGDGDGKKSEMPDDADKKADSEASTSARGASGELTALAEVHKLKAEYAADKIATERKALIASRPDFAPEMIKALAKPTTPIDTVRDLVKSLPKGPAVKAPSAKGGGTAAVSGTRGTTQGGVEALPPDEAAELDRAMGIGATRMGTRRVGDTVLLLGVMTGKPDDASSPSGSAGGAK